jgi:hypothetical protein
MKISVKPSLMILCSFILGYISIFLPGTKIQYQVIKDTQITAHEGSESVFGDKYGIDVFPCSFATYESVYYSVPVNLLLIWQLIGRILNIMAISFGVSYAIRNKMSHLNFFALTAVLMGGPPAIFLAFFNTAQPMCNPNDLYKTISFTPYLPFIIVLVVANLLGYFGARMDSNSKKSVAVTST